VGQRDEDFTRRRYAVRHRTIYTYDGDVEACLERGFLRPRETASQQVLATELVVSPDPDLISEHVDLFGNHSSFLEVRTPHTRLEVRKESLVEVAWPRVDVEALNRWTVASAVQAIADADADPVEATTFRLPSPLIELGPEVRAYAVTILPPERPLGEAITALYHDIYRGFSYKKGATSVRTTLPELLGTRAGVCQDFAHLAIGCLRSVGFPARYVSGYIETASPPGRPKLEGSDASHAWASVLVPDGTWVDLDPTNDHLADSRYIVTAWGRDFRDVSPLKGVVFTEAANSTLEVAVDVIRVTSPDADSGWPALS